MSAFFDTSVLLPLLNVQHPHHEAGFAALVKYPRKQALCAAHSMVEIYSSATRMPPPFRTAPDRALAFIEDLRQRLTIVTLTSTEYFDTLAEMAARGVIGGAIYDALIARCALKAKAEKIYTWNVRHFRQFGPEVEKKLRTP